jgi:hypothetical protein
LRNALRRIKERMGEKQAHDKGRQPNVGLVSTSDHY